LTSRRCCPFTKGLPKLSLWRDSLLTGACVGLYCAVFGYRAHMREPRRVPACLGSKLRIGWRQSPTLWEDAPARPPLARAPTVFIQTATFGQRQCVDGARLLVQGFLSRVALAVLQQGPGVLLAGLCLVTGWFVEMLVFVLPL